MDLGTLRKAWVKDSGRYDRVTTGTPTGDYDGAFMDNGANSVLNRGIRFLEMRLEEGDPLRARYIETETAAGTWFLIGPLEAKVISEVWCADPVSKARWKLSAVTMNEFRYNYPTDMDNVENGTPLIWTPARGRLAAANSGTTFTGLVDYQDTFRSVDFDSLYQGILIGPPMDTALVVSMWGKFYSEVLTDDEDVNWWTVHHPQIVMQAASYIEEIALRNRQGQADWLQPIDMMLEPIRNDSYEEESDVIKDWVEA